MQTEASTTDALVDLQMNFIYYKISYISIIFSFLLFLFILLLYPTKETLL